MKNAEKKKLGEKTYLAKWSKQAYKINFPTLH